MPNFPENTGFKLPGIGSKEKDTPGNFREDQGVEGVGYCSNTEESMLPPGSSPLLAKPHHDTGWIVPPADTPSYTGSSWPTKKSEGQRIKEQPEENEADLDPAQTPEKESITVGQPGTESYSGESAQSKLGRSMTDDEKVWMNKEIERLGGVQQYRDHYKIGTKTETPGSEFTISGYELEDSRKNKK